MKETGRNIKTGLMTAAGVALLIIALYLIGSNKNLFGDTFTLKAVFKDVNGLKEGNNVRFSGIDVGTIKGIEITGDTAVTVTMIVEQDVQPHIKKNAVAFIGTEGMMGNKLVNISAGAGPAGGEVSDGDVLRTIEPVNMDETTRTLSMTNQNVKEITDNLKNMTNKLDSSVLWSVLQDTAAAQSLRRGLGSLGETMEALQHNFLTRRYFKDKEKEQEKEKKEEKKEERKAEKAREKEEKNKKK